MINLKSEIRISKQARITQNKNSKRRTPGVLIFGNSDFEFVSDFDIRAWNFAPVCRGGFVLPLVLVVMTILVILSIGAMMASYSSRLQAVQTKAQIEAMLAAEAGYERAIFWMSQQTDILGELQSGGGSGNINFGTSRCNYEVGFADHIGARPLFRVSSTGISGRPSFTRVVDVNVVQEISGWAMGACRVPSGGTTSSETSTTPVSFVNGEIVDTPLHINNHHDDVIDISISGSPQFRQKIEMGESRKNSGGTDMYSSYMSLFHAGIDFDQPDIRITDEAAVQSKINRFRDSTNLLFRFEPNGTANTDINTPNSSNRSQFSAVQLEFFVQGGVGKVRITNQCTVLGYHRTGTNSTWDYKMRPGTSGATFDKYNIYAYHYAPDSNVIIPLVVPITDTYVTQTFGTYQSDPGGQIFVDGNVVIGGPNTIDPNMVVKGKITVVATGNIWIADSIKVDDNGGTQRDANGMPTSDNPNVLGLIARGVVKVVDPGISYYSSTSNGYPGEPNLRYVKDVRTGNSLKHYYKPIGIKRNPTDANDNRYLPASMVVEAAITCGGGGWGAENVASSSSNGRKENPPGAANPLIVRGSITECIRGVVGYPSQNDGFVKQYYADKRLMSGILPGDIWFSGKYIPAPAGWHDHSVNN